MEKCIRIVEDDLLKPDMFKVLFDLFTQYLDELGLFNTENIMPIENEAIKTSTEQLWATLIEDGKHELVKLLRHVENKEAGYGSIVVPKIGFSENRTIHDSVMSWLKEKDVNIMDVSNEISSLEESLK